MDPRTHFCHNLTCSAREQVGWGNSRIFSRKEHLSQCRTCSKTVVAMAGTLFDRLHKPADLKVTVLASLCHGCPIQTIVAALGLDEWTVAALQVLEVRPTSLVWSADMI